MSKTARSTVFLCVVLQDELVDKKTKTWMPGENQFCQTNETSQREKRVLCITYLNRK